MQSISTTSILEVACCTVKCYEIRDGYPFSRDIKTAQQEISFNLEANRAKRRLVFRQICSKFGFEAFPENPLGGEFGIYLNGKLLQPLTSRFCAQLEVSC